MNIKLLACNLLALCCVHVSVSVALSSVSTIERIAYNLQVLDLGYNILVDISPLASLTMLQKVNLEYNQMYVLWIFAFRCLMLIWCNYVVLTVLVEQTWLL